MLAFVTLLVDSKSGAANINREDEIIAGALVCADGRVVMSES
jgi:NAD(P) transhydrogenase subunit alpha